MKFRSKLIILTTICMFFILAPIISFGASATDISDTWAKNQIQAWVDKGIVSCFPDGTFKPEQAITRAEFMTLVNKAFGYTAEVPISFADVKDDTWYASVVRKAMAAGYISGYADNTIKPENTISREEAATMMMKIAKLQANVDGVSMMGDFGSMTWSSGSVGAVATASMMKGYSDGNFKPMALLSRAEAVVALDRAKSFVANNMVAHTMNGYIIDEHCFIKKPVSGSDTKVCLQMPTCAATGYGMAVLQKDGSYKFFYLDGDFAPVATAGQTEVAKLIKDTSKTDHIYVTATGKMEGDFKTAPDGISYPVMTVSTLKETTEQTFSGYIIDKHCYIKKPVPGSDTKVCLQMPTCAATGYGIAVLQNDGSYKFYYFNGSFAPNTTRAQTLSVNLINATDKTDHISITVTGSLNGDTITTVDGLTFEVLDVSKLAEK
ncbi:MAG: S-layer homology domain-containing protein [Eubacteriales bacterium]